MNKKQIEPRTYISGISCWCRHDEVKDVTELIENPRNPNKHPDKQIYLLAKIIKNQGWRQPITVSKRSGFIVKGHGRLQAAKVLQVGSVPVEFQDYATEADEYADLIADNRIAEFAEANEIQLDELLKDSMFDDFDLELTGFTDSDMKEQESLLKKLNNIQDSDINPEYDFPTELKEAHNYVVLYFDNEIDWKSAQSKLKLKTVQKPNGRSSGIGRVLSGHSVISRIPEVG